jgi:redox-sensitive bicupin YhaK (pirin superfamily)
VRDPDGNILVFRGDGSVSTEEPDAVWHELANGRTDGMIQVRKAHDRGHAQHGWLESHHTFSFAGYHDPDQMGFRSLRVINQDRVQPAKGFDTHSHQDMEIISYALAGALEHKDSMGNGSVIRPGDIQLMRAGTGVTHSEYNHSNEEVVHFLQIWILPDEGGLESAYEQRHFPPEERRGVLCLVASPECRDGSVRIHQDTDLYTTVLEKGQSVTHSLADGRSAWVQVARGSVRLNGNLLEDGDGAALISEPTINLETGRSTEVLVFDLG